MTHVTTLSLQHELRVEHIDRPRQNLLGPPRPQVPHTLLPPSITSVSHSGGAGADVFQTVRGGQLPFQRGLEVEYVFLLSTCHGDLRVAGYGINSEHNLLSAGGATITADALFATATIYCDRNLLGSDAGSDRKFPGQVVQQLVYSITGYIHTC